MFMIIIKAKKLPTGPIGMTQLRVLSLKQLKELIQDMYNQKQKYDKKCSDSQLPIETMEQYMYNYLNQRYGLKNLIIEWAAAIINGVKRYNLEDCDVTLFSKILRNECDEDFRFVYNEVKTAMTDILKEKLKRKFRNKSESEILSMMKQIQSGDIEEYQWKEIIEKMYNEHHFAILEQQIKEQIEEQNAQNTSTDRRRIQKGALDPSQKNKIPYKEFQKVNFNYCRLFWISNFQHMKSI